MTKFLYCYVCSKQVSTGFVPIPTDTPDEGIIIRALVICPECMEKELIWKEDQPKNGQRTQM